jgi:hypothetical protein
MAGKLEHDPNNRMEVFGGDTEQETGAAIVTTSSSRTVTEDPFSSHAFSSVAVELSPTEQEFERHWNESPFAVGNTKPTWADEEVNCRNLCNACGSMDQSVNITQPGYVFCTAFLCRCLSVRHVRNMVVLKQKLVEYYDEETAEEGEEAEEGSRRLRPKLQCVVGPYFGITLSLTLPFLIGLTAFTLYMGILKNEDLHWGVILGWAIVMGAMFVSLFKTSFSDPGILYRHSTIPCNATQEWRWNDQARSYRPSGARFDTEVQAIVEGYDHTCPFVGTAIGKGNMQWFQRFLIFLVAMVIFDVILLAFL